MQNMNQVKLGEPEKPEKIKVTSAEIKKALALINTKAYFLTEVKSGSSYMGTANRILDAIAIHKSYTNKCIVGYEIKVSRSDFKGDNKMFTYLPLVHKLYLVCPKGLIQPEELPLEIGLMWYNPEKKTLTYKKKTPAREIEISTDMLLYIIYSRLEHDRIPFYSDKAEFYRDWLDDKITNKELGRKVGSRLPREVAVLTKRLEEKELLETRDTSRLKSLLHTLVELGMPKEYQIFQAEQWLRRELAERKQGYPKILDDVTKHLNSAMHTIAKEKEKGAQHGDISAT
jgi:hypothetical protein